jgi:hypothetical protein
MDGSQRSAKPLRASAPTLKLTAFDTPTEQDPRHHTIDNKFTTQLEWFGLQLRITLRGV